ncbi:glycosyltransferase [Candidatus Gottesmanbacteria bacterium]|nr:glycosyltransferase [Candidatus Gottesmanbacteria bacterium]
MNLLQNSSVLIISHYYTRTISGGGPAQEVRDFLLKKVNKIVYIEHPFPYADDKRSSMRIYQNGKLISQYFTPIRCYHEIIFYIADIWISAKYILQSHISFTACIALDSLNTVSVMPFRLLGKISKLIFYSIDYVPVRFESKPLNFLYHLVDKVACMYSDALWVLSPKMTEMRKKYGITRIAPQVMLPMGANLSRIHPLPISKINRHQLVFAGHLLEKQGLQLMIKALPYIINRITDVQLLIIGKGEYENTLKALVKSLQLAKYVQFLGFIKNHDDLEKILCASAIGLAPYTPTPDSYTYFTDPGKPKLYLGCGLPVVITNVPPIAETIQFHHAGFMVEYQIKNISDSIIKLLTNEKLYSTYRRNALKLAKKFDTNYLIEEAIKNTL